MRKQLMLLAAGGLFFASCSSNSNNSQAQTQAQIDSTVNAKLAQHDQENAMKNDSTLRAMEAEKAATMERERAHDERRHEEHAGGNSTSSSATPANNTQAPAPVNSRTGSAGPTSVNDRPGAH